METRPSIMPEQRTTAVTQRIRLGLPDWIQRPGAIHPVILIVGVFCIGSFATAAQLGLFAVLLPLIGETVANVIAWTVSSVAGNVVKRRFAFGVDVHSARRDLTVSMLSSLAGLVASIGTLGMVDVEGAVGAVGVMIAVNLTLGGIRFLALQQ
jgi:putative flippase GtrA